MASAAHIGRQLLIFGHKPRRQMMPTAQQSRNCRCKLQTPKNLRPPVGTPNQVFSLAGSTTSDQRDR
jgi:hypothetical protein